MSDEGWHVVDHVTCPYCTLRVYLFAHDVQVRWEHQFPACSAWEGLVSTEP